MKTTTFEIIVSWIRKHYKVLTIFLTVLMLVGFYFFITSMPNNHLAYSHVMYIAIVFAGGVLGGFHGLLTALIAGLLVGPMMPYNLATGDPQKNMDWIFRLTMMMIVGLMSGYFSKSFRYANEEIRALKTINVDSGLHNMNYLNEVMIKTDDNYLLMTMIIANYKTVCEVAGYKIYYNYLNKLRKDLKELFPDMVLIHVEINRLWLLKPSEDYDFDIGKISALIKSVNEIDQTKFFIDFGLGFHHLRIENPKKIDYYFTDTDTAANEALDKHMLYAKFSNIDTLKKYEYELLSIFEESLKNGHIYLVYQPKIDLKTRKPVGLEALIRWHHPLKKIIYPDQFISAVEKTSLVHLMTEEVFRKSLTFQQKLKDRGIEIPISINISTKNLYDMSFYEHMIAIFKEFTISPKMIELEITETVLMEKPDLSKIILDKFSEFGFKIAIDDFGKGYSSLAYLAQFPIHTVKIDRSFTQQILFSPTTQTVIKATISLALQLGYEILIEGVEDEKTANMAESLGCQSAQGYHFLKPQEEVTIIDYLSTYYT